VPAAQSGSGFNDPVGMKALYCWCTLVEQAVIQAPARRVSDDALKRYTGRIILEAENSGKWARTAVTVYELEISECIGALLFGNLGE